MLKNITKNKIVLFIILLSVALAIPLTIIQVQKQQNIRQRAQEIQTETSLYFTKKDSQESLTNITLPPNEKFSIDVYLVTKEVNVSSFGITIQLNDNTKNIKVDEGKDAISKFNTLLSKDIGQQKKFVKFEKINFTKEPFINRGNLHLLTLTFEVGELAGTIEITEARITSPGRKDYATVLKPTLSYEISKPTPIPTKEPTATPTRVIPSPKAIIPITKTPGAYTLSGTVFLNSNGKRVPFNPSANNTALIVIPLYIEKSGGFDLMAIQDNGEYSFKNVPKGVYQLFFRMPNGFTPVESGGNVIGVTLDSDKIVDFDLMPYPQGVSPTLTKEDKNRQDQLIVKYHTIFADCFDSNHPVMTDPLSKYNSSDCKSHPERAHLDINRDGKVDAVDLNIFIRSIK